jgi:hypothetical protein
MYDLITAVEDLIDILLKVIQGVLDTLFSLLGDALKAFRTLVTEPINIPVISWIYRQVAGHTLTMLDLFCLALAVPATLLYKLTFGVAHATPPFAEQQANDIVAALSDPATFPWPAIASKQASGSEGLLGSFPFPGSQALIPLAFLGLAFTDTWSDAIAYLKANRPPTNYTKDPAALYVSYSNIVFGLFARWLTAPFSLFATHGITTGETMQLSFWASGFLISAVNLVFTTAPKVGSPATGLAKFSIGYGVPLISTIGFFLTFLGIATTGVQIYEDATGKATYNAFQGIDNEVCMLPTALTALLEVKGEPAAEIAAAVLAAADFVFDLASGALGFTAALTSP